MPDAFMIVLTDGESDIYTYSIPNQEYLPTILYPTYGQARIALHGYVESLTNFLAVAYGEAYPYEHTTFEQELAEKGFACYGWQSVEDPESGLPIKVKIGLLRVQLL